MLHRSPSKKFQHLDVVEKRYYRSLAEGSICCNSNRFSTSGHQTSGAVLPNNLAEKIQPNSLLLVCSYFIARKTKDKQQSKYVGHNNASHFTRVCVSLNDGVSYVATRNSYVPTPIKFVGVNPDIKIKHQLTEPEKDFGNRSLVHK